MEEVWRYPTQSNREACSSNSCEEIESGTTPLDDESHKEIYEQKKCGLEKVQRIENRSKLHKVQKIKERNKQEG